jgi:hypothetical protein
MVRKPFGLRSGQQGFNRHQRLEDPGHRNVSNLVRIGPSAYATNKPTE